MSAGDGKDTEKEESLLVRLQNGTVTLEISVRVLKKLKIDLPQDLPLLGIYPKNLYILLQRHVLISVQCCSIPNSQEVETD